MKGQVSHPYKARSRITLPLPSYAANGNTKDSGRNDSRPSVNLVCS